MKINGIDNPELPFFTQNHTNRLSDVEAPVTYTNMVNLWKQTRT